MTAAAIASATSASVVDNNSAAVGAVAASVATAVSVLITRCVASSNQFLTTAVKKVCILCVISMIWLALFLNS